MNLTFEVDKEINSLTRELEFKWEDFQTEMDRTWIPFGKVLIKYIQLFGRISMRSSILYKLKFDGFKLIQRTSRGNNMTFEILYQRVLIARLTFQRIDEEIKHLMMSHHIDNKEVNLHFYFFNNSSFEKIMNLYNVMVDEIKYSIKNHIWDVDAAATEHKRIQMFSDGSTII
jgi:hypothetical protein